MTILAVIASIAFAVVVAVAPFFLSFFLSQMITRNMVMMLLRRCKEKNYELESEAR